MFSREDRVDGIFRKALPLVPAERILLLDRTCQGAPELRHAVEVLLAARDDTGSFVEGAISPPRQIARVPAGGAEPCPRDPSALDAHRSFQTGDVLLARFTILRFIASGGMGEVWEAWDSQLQEHVALKTIRADMARHPEAVESFRREVKQTRAISHPNVCRIHELFTYETDAGSKGLFLCMEFLDGPTLSEYLDHKGPLVPDTALSIVEQLVEGLNSAHSLGLVHCDLKPRNIMLVSADPGKMRVVITDFGLSSSVFTADGEGKGGTRQGTPDYMAPEQYVSGNVTALTDQYALGVVICEMITGVRPIRTKSESGGSGVSVRLPAKSVPRQWANVIERSLSTSPKDRFPRLSDLLLQLRPTQRKRLSWVERIAIACALLAVSIGVWQSRPAEATSLAVLPLRNATGDSKLDYVSAGLTEALTNDLAGMPGLQVKAAGIAERYPSQRTDPGESGRRLNVHSVVSGAFFEDGTHLRIPIEIIDVSSGSQIWGTTYEGNISNLAGLQNDISTDVAYHLKVRLNPDMKNRLKRQYTTNPTAYNAYLQGRYRLTHRSHADLQTASTDFHNALDADSNYAPAYAGLADSYGLLAQYGAGNQIPMMRNALEAANRALALDSTLGEAYASRAWARTMLQYEWKEAESDYKRALELNPRSLQAHMGYAVSLLAPLGRDAEAEAQLAIVQAEDPHSLTTNISRAMVAQCGGHMAESASLLEEQLKSTPSLEPAIEVLAVDYFELKRSQEAIQLLQTAPVEPELRGQRDLVLGIAYALVGDRGGAEKWLHQASETVDVEQLFPYQTAVYYNAVGNQTKALDLLELSYTERDTDLLFVNVDPRLKSLHSNIRFQSLLSRMNLQ